VRPRPISPEIDDVTLANTPSNLAYKQVRSKRTFDRLLDAGEAVIVEQGFDAATVVEICARAKLSVGAFYRRFESKDGLLEVLHERYYQQMADAAKRTLDPERWRDASIAEFIYRWLLAVFGTNVRRAAFIRASKQHCYISPSFAARERRIHAMSLELLTNLLLDHADEIGLTETHEATKVSSFMLLAGSNYHADQLVHSPFSDAEVARHLATTVVSYLRVTRPSYEFLELLDSDRAELRDR
jgi:AcrR family transcriptional regulator